MATCKQTIFQPKSTGKFIEITCLPHAVEVAIVAIAFAMVSKKQSRGTRSHGASANATQKHTNQQASNKSAIFRSSFSPSPYQLALFASVVQGLDSQHLRIHDTLTGRLRCDHAISSRATINSLDWGKYNAHSRGSDEQPVKKKRKRNEELNGDAGDNVVVAFGTSDSDIQIFSPAEGKVVAVLQGAHTQGVRDFKFTNRESSEEGWSLGGDGKLAQWNLRTQTSIRQVLTVSAKPT